MRIIKPSSLKRGDVIGLVSPASTPNDMQKLDNGIRYLEKNGYRVKLGENVGKSNGYLAGSDQERANDINTMFKDKSVKAIFCIRGGYGASRILDKLDYKTIKNNPKIFVRKCFANSLIMSPGDFMTAAKYNGFYSHL